MKRFLMMVLMLMMLMLTGCSGGDALGGAIAGLSLCTIGGGGCCVLGSEIIPIVIAILVIVALVGFARKRMVKQNTKIAMLQANENQKLAAYNARLNPAPPQAQGSDYADRASMKHFQ